MVHQLRVGALQTQFLVEVDGMSDVEAARLREQWSRVQGTGAAAVTLSVVQGRYDPAADVSGRTFEHVSAALRSAINLRAIEARRTDLLLLHAAGLADPATGEVVALLGPSGAGKTTAASTLGVTMGYVSDETVAVTPAGEVVAFPKPVAIKPADGGVKEVRGPDALGLAPAGDGLRLARIVLLDRSEQPVEPSITTLSLSDAFAAVIAETSYFGSLPYSLRVLQELVARSGGVHVVQYHQAAELIEPIAELLQRPPGRVESPAPVPAWGTTPHVTSAVETYRRCEEDDWVDDHGLVLVHRGGEVARLSPLGSVLWLRMSPHATLAELVVAAESAFGPAPTGDSSAGVRAQLDELVDAGLVVVRPAPA